MSGWDIYGLVVCGAAALIMVSAAMVTVTTRIRRRGVPVAQQEAELEAELRAGVPDRRGFVAIDPAEYPGVPKARVVEIALGLGLVEQPEGNRGRYRFHRAGAGTP